MAIQPKEKTIEELEEEIGIILEQVEVYNCNGMYTEAYMAGLDSAGLVAEYFDRKKELEEAQKPN